MSLKRFLRQFGEVVEYAVFSICGILFVIMLLAVFGEL